MKENKREKFERLTVYRVNEVVEKLRILGQTGNRNLYEYDDNQTAAIVAVIEDAWEDCKKKFDAEGEKTFTLPWSKKR